MLKQFGVRTNEISPEDFLKVAALYCSTKEATLKGILFIAFYQQKANINKMLKQFGVSVNEIYQEGFLKVAVLNCSTKRATVSSFHRAPCS